MNPLSQYLSEVRGRWATAQAPTDLTKLIRICEVFYKALSEAKFDLEMCKDGGYNHSAIMCIERELATASDIAGGAE